MAGACGAGTRTCSRVASRLSGFHSLLLATQVEAIGRAQSQTALLWHPELAFLPREAPGALLTALLQLQVLPLQMQLHTQAQVVASCRSLQAGGQAEA
jgi:hypothetical protein